MTSTLRILWIDLRRERDAPAIASTLTRKHKVAKVNRVESAVDIAHEFHPGLACAEFDYPDEAQLRVVPAMTHAFPSLPLLMFTEYHSEALAVWAFRSGVKDYRVKPVDAKVLNDLVAHFAIASPRARRQQGGNGMSPGLISPGDHLRSPPTTTVRTAAAVAYIATHYPERVTQGAVASMCHLSPSEFSRVFRREHECTFERFLLEFRIAKARDLLVVSRMPITQVAHSVGFADSSYFARAFRQLAGISASEWRRRSHAPSSPHAA